MQVMQICDRYRNRNYMDKDGKEEKKKERKRERDKRRQIKD